MRRLASLSLPLLALACGHRDAPPAAEHAPTLAVRGAPVADSAGAFVVLRGRDTLATERFSRAGGRLSGVVRTHGRRGHTARTTAYAADLAPDGSITRLTVRRLGMPAGDTAVVLPGDSLLHVSRRGVKRVARRDTATPGLIPYYLPSVALAEQVLRAARARGGDSARVRVLALNGGGVRESVLVRWLPGDSALASVSGNQLRLALDPAGRSILGGWDPNLEIRLERVER